MNVRIFFLAIAVAGACNAPARAEELSPKAKAEIAELTAKIKEQPSAALYAERAVRFDQNKRYKDALADIDIAIRIQPNSAKYHDKRTSVLNHLHRFTEAIKESNLTMQLSHDDDFDYIGGLVHRSYAYEKLGKKHESDKDYALAQRINRDKHLGLSLP